MVPIETDDVSGKPCLQVDNLSCVRGDRLLFKDVNFKLHRGELVHVAGPNGSGKTTLLRIVCNLTWPESGQALWRGEPINRSERFQRESAYIGHQDGLKSELSTLENLRFHSRVLNADVRRLPTIVQQLELNRCQYLLAGKLSAGQRRRAALARLLLAERVLWILDEPFTALDRNGRQVVENLLEQHLENRGLVLLTSHQAFMSTHLTNHRRELSLS
ncbi:MAG: Cytochrome c biogenesis ATP-binding export protein CcmA [Gammaproteobacteria bacterium]|nr:Cytochrome c biogenesis ATP-binding export protein CcmA [Gammaproteobacteria bacterium]